MPKFLFISVFCLLIAVTLFDASAGRSSRQEIQLAQSGGNAHGCPKGQMYSKAKKSCVPAKG